jgi:hypothetical protein
MQGERISAKPSRNERTNSKEFMVMT